MKCLNCGKEFTSARSTAKFDSEKCKKQYQRSGTNNDVSGTEPLTGQDSGTNKSFTPNWKRKGYASKREALLAVMVALGENHSLEEQVFHIGNTSWEVKKGKMVRIA